MQHQYLYSVVYPYRVHCKGDKKSSGLVVRFVKQGIRDSLSANASLAVQKIGQST